jgi:hypothetical protein
MWVILGWLTFLLIVKNPSAMSQVEPNKDSDDVISEAQKLTNELNDETYRQLKNTLISYQKTSDAVKKLQLADVLASFDELSLQLEPYKRLSSQDRDAIKDAVNLANRTKNFVVAFESSLSKSEQTNIAAGFPNSLARHFGSFMQDSNPAACPEKTYKAMRSEIGLQKLLRFGVDAGILAGLYEDQKRPVYYSRLLKIAESKKCSTEACSAARIHYRAGIQTMSTDIWHKQILKSISIAENSLIERNFPKTEFTSTVYQWAISWPECLGKISITLTERLRSDLTVERGKYLLTILKDLKTEEVSTYDWNNIPLDPSDPIKEDVRDAWGDPFQIVRDSKEKRNILRSSGPDGQPATNDDLEIHP